jgi:U3 small nucleolar RNA-associated protein 10
MLQAQLAQSKSLNAALLKSHKNVDSYLFSPQQAAQHDLDSLYALACNGLQFLASSQSSSSSHSRKRTRDHHDDLRSILNNSLLFMPSTKVMRDRTTLSPDENDLINNEVDNVLYAISPWLTEQAAGGVIEWLVRRYR